MNKGREKIINELNNFVIKGKKIATDFNQND